VGMFLDYLLILLLVVDQGWVGQATFEISKFIIYIMESIKHGILLN
jgi:hypothetical protein